MNKLISTFALVLAISVPALGWRTFWKGRRFDGNVGHPTDFHRTLEAENDEDLWFKQKLDHFEPTNDKTWNQVRSTLFVLKAF